MANDSKLANLADVKAAFDDVNSRAGVTGVKGNAETTYRHGDVNLTPANIGAVAKTGDTITGTLVLSKTADASGTADNGPALVVGGTRTTAHLEMDANEIIAKSDGTHGTTLYLNNDGEGIVQIGSGGLQTNGNIIQTAGCLSGNNNDLTHIIKLGHYDDNKLEFHEYGGQFDFYKTESSTNKKLLFQIKNGTSSAPLPLNNGGTGATNATSARSNLGIKHVTKTMNFTADPAGAYSDYNFNQDVVVIGASVVANREISVISFSRIDGYTKWTFVLHQTNAINNMAVDITYLEL